jgi:cytochrome c-type biogenesis protein CcmH/NrfG
MKVEEFVSEQIEEETNAIPELSIDLVEAKIALSKGNIDDAVSIFSEHIKSSSSLDEIISELKNSLDHYYPIDISLWQTLGDAYFKKNQLKNALAAYSKAEELLI